MEEYPTCRKIVELSFQKFENLPRNSENNIEKWSVLSTILQYYSKTKDIKVVALGTGTKCIGVDKMCPNGTILNDSHAEVICRRSFIRYLYYNILNPSDIIKFDESKLKFIINPEISFHFFSTHPPCGDATITEKNENKDETVPTKKMKLENDVVCTGGKLLGVTKGIDNKTGIKYDPLDQDIGALRTKPGRGVRTLSMSCSDKLAKWNILGLQGALLDLLLESPIYIKTFNFCGDVQQTAIERALFKRWIAKNFEHDRFICQKPVIRTYLETNFKLAKLDEKNSSTRSVAWSNIPNRDKPFEIAVNGKKEGVTKKALKSCSSSGSLQISKIMLAKKFIEVLNAYPSLKINLIENNILLTNEISYKDLKNLSKTYQNAWCTLVKEYFGEWTTKPELLNFKTKL